MENDDLLGLILSLFTVVVVAWIIARAFDMIEFSFDQNTGRFDFKAKKDRDLDGGAPPLILSGN
ncbi:MAG: hypothetical protein WB524_00560 [Acidobacteriaceae bacterium]|jgi:hypothetical protein